MVTGISSSGSPQLSSSAVNELLSGSTSKSEKKNAGESSDLINGLDLDQFNLSDDAKKKITYAQAQFEVNYQVLKSINTSQGLETQEATFSFKASYEFLQKVSGKPSTGSATGTTAGTTSADSTTTADATSASASSSSTQDSLSALQEYFSPEKTAERILDIATSFYGVSNIYKTEGDSETSRQKFADFIGSAIDKGFQRAADILGDLPDDTQSDIDKTHSLVSTGLENFVKKGIDSSKTGSGGVMDKIAAYRQEAAQYTSQVTKALSTGEYNSRGTINVTETQTWTISTSG